MTLPGEIAATPWILLVAATEAELCGDDGHVCGVGPIEAAASTAGVLAARRPDAVLHVGLAGGRGLELGAIAIGLESVYCDLAAAIPVVNRASPDPALVAAAQRCLPDAYVGVIGTSAAVAGPCATLPALRVEAMEGFGVLRACELAQVPAVEVRAISNEIGEGDRSRWRVREALLALGEARTSLLRSIQTSLAEAPASPS